MAARTCEGRSPQHRDGDSKGRVRLADRHALLPFARAWPLGGSRGPKRRAPSARDLLDQRRRNDSAPRLREEDAENTATRRYVGAQAQAGDRPMKKKETKKGSID